MATLQDQFAAFDVSAVPFWAITATKRQFFLESDESRDYIETKLKQHDQSSLLQDIQHEFPALLNEGHTYVYSTRPAFYMIGNKLCKEFEKNQSLVFQRLNDLVEEYDKCEKKLHKLVFTDASEQVFTPLRESFQLITQMWQVQQGKIDKNIEGLKKEPSSDFNASFGQLSQDAPEYRLQAIHGFLSSFQGHVQEVIKEDSPFMILYHQLKSLVEDWNTIDSLCREVLQQPSAKFLPKSQELQRLFEKMGEVVTPDAIPLVPASLSAPVGDPACGRFNLTDYWTYPFPWDQHTLTITIPFDYPQPSIPKVLLSIAGLNVSDISGSYRVPVDVNATGVTTDGVTLSIGTEILPDNPNIQNLCILYLLLRADDTRFKTGTERFIVSSDAQRKNCTMTKKIAFKGAQFDTTPKVLCWFTGFDILNDPLASDKFSIVVVPVEISTEGFGIQLTTQISSDVRFLSVGWAAFPRAVGSGNDDIHGGVYPTTDLGLDNAVQVSLRDQSGFSLFSGISRLDSKSSPDCIIIEQSHDSVIPTARKLDLGFSWLKIKRPPPTSSAPESSINQSEESADPEKELAALRESFAEYTAESSSIIQNQALEISSLRSNVSELSVQLKATTKAMEQAKSAYENEVRILSLAKTDFYKKMMYYKYISDIPRSLAGGEVKSYMQESERDYADLWASRIRCRNIRFGRPVGTPGGGPFWSQEGIESLQKLEHWPYRIVVKMGALSGYEVIGRVEVYYPGTQPFATGKSCAKTLDFFLEKLEKVTRMWARIGNGWGNKRIIQWLKFATNKGREYELGSRTGDEEEVWEPYDGTTGLKGFYGMSGLIIDRVGPIWGF